MFRVSLGQNSPIVLSDLKIMFCDAFSQIGYSSPSQSGIMTDLALTVAEVNETYRFLLSSMYDHMFLISVM